MYCLKTFFTWFWRSTTTRLEPLLTPAVKKTCMEGKKKTKRIRTQVGLHGLQILHLHLKPGPSSKVSWRERTMVQLWWWVRNLEDLIIFTLLKIQFQDTYGKMGILFLVWWDSWLSSCAENKSILKIWESLQSIWKETLVNKQPGFLLMWRKTGTLQRTVDVNWDINVQSDISLCRNEQMLISIQHLSRMLQKPRKSREDKDTNSGAKRSLLTFSSKLECFYKIILQINTLL